MKMKRTYLLAIFLMIQSLPSIAQNVENIKSVNIGDKIPDISIRELIGSTKRSVRISDLYKKGALIIDFWASWCGNCLEEMPLADTLVGRHSDLTILAVSHDDSLATAKFLKTRKDIPHANIIITSDDKKLSAFFKHRGIPHNIWIDKSGTVRLISAGYAINEKYVNQFLHGITPRVRVKKEQRGIFKAWKPYHIEDSLLYYRSVFTKYNDTLPGGQISNAGIPVGACNKVFFYNQNITSMYWLAYCDQLSSEINWKAVEIRTKDSVKFFYPNKTHSLFLRSKYNSGHISFDEASENWAVENCFCYDLILPKPLPENVVSSYIFEDLNRFFNVKGTVEKKVIEATVIRKSNNFDSLKVKRFTPDANYQFRAGKLFRRANNSLFIQNRTIEQVMGYLVTYLGLDPAVIPLVNETNINYPITMNLNFAKNENITYDTICKALEENGLILTREMRNVATLILTDSN